jgi:hypothetical protein
MNKEFFEKNYGKIMIVPIVLLIISLVFIGYQYTSSGDVVDRDVTLKGGVSATIYTDKEFDVDEVTNRLAK